MKVTSEQINGLFMGIAVGDALGVSVEFKSRQSLKASPVSEMTGYGTYNQLPGTWSDDSSLTFCLAESLCKGFNLNDLAERFVQWYDLGYWTARGEVFDVGNATERAIRKLKEGEQPILAGGKEDWENGNGSLMRILPLSYFLLNVSPYEHYDMIRKVSSLTHAHERAVFACYFYTTMGICLLKGHTIEEAYYDTQGLVKSFLSAQPNILSLSEHKLFERVLTFNATDWRKLPENDIQSTGYVLHTLEASVWCLLGTDNYQDAVLRAINLGEDTDTTGAVTGGLAGLYYGLGQIPAKWINALAKKDNIMALATRFYQINQHEL
jgi:ADP-ribosyl-[dinitrogen reductase] hydrolase